MKDCHEAPVSIHIYEESTWYKCKRCGENCEIQEADLVNDNTVVKLIDRMRIEDELVGKFLATMGIIANKPEEQTPSVQTTPPTQYVESRELPPVEKKLTEDMKKLTESQLSEIRRTTEAMIKDALDGSEES